MLTRLVNRRELWFVVVANPDGYDFTFTPDNRLWRKNLREINGEPGIQIGDGVDLNRNYPDLLELRRRGLLARPDRRHLSRHRSPHPSPRRGRSTASSARRLRVHGQLALGRRAAALRPWLPGSDRGSRRRDLPCAVGHRRRLRRFRAARPERPTPTTRTSPPSSTRPTARRPSTSTSSHGTLAWTPEMDVGDPDRGGGPSVFSSRTPSPTSRTRSRRTSRSRSTSPSRPTIRPTPSRTSGARPPVRDPAVLGLLRRPADRLGQRPARARRRLTMHWTRQRRAGAERVHLLVGGRRALRRPPGRLLPRGSRRGHRHDRRRRASASGSRAAASARRRSPTRCARTPTTACSCSPPRTTRVTSNSPAYPSTTGPYFHELLHDALAANGVGYDVYDVDAEGRRAPDPLGVLSHYDAVDLVHGQRPAHPRVRARARGPASRELANDMIVNVRDFLNEGGKLLYTGQYAATAQLNAFVFNVEGEPPFCPPGGPAAEAPASRSPTISCSTTWARSSTSTPPARRSAVATRTRSRRSTSTSPAASTARPSSRSTGPAAPTTRSTSTRC